MYSMKFQHVYTSSFKRSLGIMNFSDKGIMGCQAVYVTYILLYSWFLRCQPWGITYHVSRVSKWRLSVFRQVRRLTIKR